MLYAHEQEEQSLNKFLLVSLIVHALLFVTYPQWSQYLESDGPGLEPGGAIQVVHLDASPARESAPVMDPDSTTVTPGELEPRPSPEPPEETPAVAVETEPDAVDMEPEEPDLPTPEPQPVPEEEAEEEAAVADEPMPEPLPPPETEVDLPPDDLPVVAEAVDIEEPQGLTTDELVSSSESEYEVAVEEQGDAEATEEDALHEDELLEPESAAEEAEGEEPLAPSARDDMSASGTDELGAVSEDGETAAASGEGEDEASMPAPPPPPSAHSLRDGGGSPIYPKSAEHDGSEGIVALEVSAEADGTVIAVEIAAGSGDSRLDEQARRTIEHLWSFHPADRDYLLTLEVEFARVVDGDEVRFDTEVYFVDVRWLEQE